MVIWNFLAFRPFELRDLGKTYCFIFLHFLNFELVRLAHDCQIMNRDLLYLLHRKARVSLLYKTCFKELQLLVEALLKLDALFAEYLLYKVSVEALGC